MYCNQCGTPLKEGAKFCHVCGTPCGMAAPLENQPSRKASHKDGLFMVLIIVVGAFAILLPIGMNIMKNGNIGISNTNINSQEESCQDVSFQGYTFTISQSLQAIVEEDTLYIYGLQNGTGYASLEIENSNYSELKGEIEYLRFYMQRQGYRVGNAEERVYAQVEFLLIPIEEGNQSILLAYSPLDEQNTLLIVVSNYDGTVDESLLSELAPIIASAQEKNSNTVTI